MRLISMLLLMALALVPPAAFGQTPVKTHDALVREHPLPPPAPGPSMTLAGEKRRVLVLYKEREAARPCDHPLFRRAGAVLSHLGLVPEYRSVEEGLPSDGEMEAFRGVVTWHTTPFMRNAARYGEWLARQAKGGVKVVILGDYGAFVDADESLPVPDGDRVFAAMGMEVRARTRGAGGAAPVIALRDLAMVGSLLDASLLVSSTRRCYRSVSAANAVCLRLADEELGAMDLVVITPQGGLALEGSPWLPSPREPSSSAALRPLLLDAAPELPDGAWNVNPEIFFTRALALGDVPAPDCAVMSGRRILTCSIGGDGFGAPSGIDGSLTAGHYVVKEILEAFPAMPFTVSLVTEPLERDGALREAARAMFALPNVESASHSATHPGDWRDGDPVRSDPGSGSPALLSRKPDCVKELWGSRLFIEKNLLAEGRACRVLLWTGASNPDEEAESVAGRAGLFTASALPGFLSLYRWRGTDRTLLPVRPTASREEAERAMGAAGAALRSEPVSLLIDFAAGASRPRLDEAKEIVKTCLLGEFVLMPASECSAVLEDFHRTALRREGDTWHVYNGGALRTIRFPSRVTPDLERSVGVAGYRHVGGETYVHLDGRRQRAVVLDAKAPPVLHLREGNVAVDEAACARESLTLTVRGRGTAFLLLAGCAPSCAWRVTLTTAGEAARVEKSLSSEGDGTLKVEMPLAAAPASYVLRVQREGVSR